MGISQAGVYSGDSGSIGPMLEPTAENLALVEARQRRLRRLLRGLLWPMVALDPEHPHRVPDHGPALIVGNHGNAFDPLFISAVSPRPILWVGTASLREGRLSSLVDGLGMIPKRRFYADTKTVRAMRRWLEVGAVVAVFPEGNRTWTGRLGPLQPGVERLARMLGAPVLPVRMHNAYLQWPRWGSPRVGRVGVEFGEPRELERRGDVAEMRAWLERQLDVDPRSRPLPLRGVRLARGLSNLIFRCPRCSVEAMTEQGDAVVCAGCSGRWRIDVRAMVHGPEGSRALDVVAGELRDAALAELVGPELLRSAPLVLQDIGDGAHEVGRGELVLYADRLALEAGQRTLWTVPRAEVLNLNVEYERALELRTDERYYRAMVTEGSAWRWTWTWDATASG